MERLRAGSALASVYGAADGISTAMLSDAEALRELLAVTIASAHPAGPHALSADEFAHCRAFLLPFNNVYTANYDLLLYWAALNNESGQESIRADDGFRQPEDGPEDYVVWEPEQNYSQTIHYLHGALHLFDAGPELRKYTWRNTGVPLIGQIRSALALGMFPHIVTEGTADEKLARIYHSAYLAKSLRSFSNIGGGLIVLGMAFTSNDQHLFKAMVRSKVTRFGVGVFGDATSDSNKALIATAESLALLASETRRGRHRDIEIRFFNAATAPVWRTPRGE